MIRAIITFVVLYPVIFLLEVLFLFSNGDFMYRHEQALIRSEILGFAIFGIPLVISLLVAAHTYKKSLRKGIESESKDNINILPAPIDKEERAYLLVKGFFLGFIQGVSFLIAGLVIWLLFNFSDATLSLERERLYEIGNYVIITLSILILIGQMISSIKKWQR